MIVCVCVCVWVCVCVCVIGKDLRVMCAPIFPFCLQVSSFIFLQIQISHHLIYPLTTRVVRAPQMISQPVSSIFPCSPLPSGTWRNTGLSIPWCCLPTSSSVCLVFFPLSLCLAIWFWLDPMNGRHDHTTAVCVSLQWPGGLCVVWLLLNLGTDFHVGNMVSVWDA